MNTITWLQLGAGLVLLVVGAEGLVRGASRIAILLGVSPLVIGLTVVAFGTGSPELAVSIQASFSGQTDLAVGNVVGSNIFNLLVILGLAAAVTPLVVHQQLVRLDVPILIGISLLFWLMAMDGKIGRIDGIVLFAGIVAYTVFEVVQARREKDAEVRAEYEHEYAARPGGGVLVWLLNLGLVAGGLALLVLGSGWLVTSATAIAQALNVSPLIIGLTIVAAGTSLPEAATSVIASLRGERDIAVGNAVGSSIFNILAVIGVSGILAPQGIAVSAAALNFDIPVMVVASLACLPIFFTGYLIARWEGFLFLGYYIAYATYLFLATTQHDALPLFSSVMALFVIPLTVLTLAVIVWRTLLAPRTG
jgi:cation:H+ antiporter